MVFKKAKCRANNSTGRKLKSPDDTLATNTKEKHAQYWRDAMRKSRARAKDTANPSLSKVGRPYIPDTPMTPRPSSSKLGRPCIGDTPMTPRSLNKRKCLLGRKKYRGSTIPKKRSEAVKKRWSMKNKSSSCTMSVSDELASSSSESEIEYPDLADEKSPAESVERKHKYHKLKLQQLLSKEPLQNLDFLVHYCRSFSSRLSLDTANYVSVGKLGARALRYNGDKINKFFDKLNDDFADKLLLYWLENLVEHNLVQSIFDEHRWVLPPRYSPLKFKVIQAAAKLAEHYLKRDQTTNNQRILGTRYVAEVAKTSGLTLANWGSVSILAKHTNCSRQFAKSVLQAIENNDLESFVSRNTRCDSIHADRQWTDQILNFVMKPENSRAVPGLEQISIKYGVRRPKFILRKPRAIIASEFIDAHPSCPFKSCTIMREFPQNAVTASSSDKKRNSCPYHCNARRLINALHVNNTARSVSTSCREMVILCMCNDGSINANDPTQWNKDCVHGNCKYCPMPYIKIPIEKSNNIISFSLWEYGIDELKKKKQEAKGGKKADGKVYGLFRHDVTITEAVIMFLDMMPKLKVHVFTAYSQWNAHTVNRLSLDDTSVITIEDYQQNLEIEYAETPTAMAYSSNKTTVALYPIVAEYEVNGVPHKGAIVFISDDKLHDFQQVSRFEERMFQILRDKVPHQIHHWQRWSDGCGHQFRSRFCNAEIQKIQKRLQLQSVKWEYFEAHEGKNLSDALGSMIKTKCLRKMLDHPDGVRSAGDVVDLISDLPESTEKFSFIAVEEFKEFDRIPPKDRDDIPIQSILKVHSIKTVPCGLLAQLQTCTSCSPSILCDKCLELPPTVITEEAEDSEDDGERVCDDDIAITDNDSDSEDDTENTETNFGYAVWAKYYRTWYPSKVVSANELPASLKKKLANSEGLVPVQWYGDSSYSLIQQRNVDTLAQNRIDEARAAVSVDMLVKYNNALSDVHND